MFRLLGAAVAAVVLSCGTASAATTFYEFQFTGTLTELVAPGPDPNYEIGTTLTVTARVADYRVVNWGDTGYKVAFIGTMEDSRVPASEGLLPTSGEQYFRIDGPAESWSADASMDDWGYSYNFYEPNGISGFHFLPAIIFNETGVVGFDAYLLPAGGNLPTIYGGSHVGLGHHWIFWEGDENDYEVTEENVFSTPTLSTNFDLVRYNVYTNTSTSGNFKGQWDFSNSVKISAVPEPATWAMMIIGFGAAGASIRRRRHATTLANAA